MREGRIKQIQEQRRQSRRHLVAATAVRHATFIGRIINRSANGIAIESDKGLRIGASYRLELATIDGEAVIEAIVRWCRLVSVRPGATEGEFQPLFQSGFELAASDAASLAETVDSTTSEHGVRSLLGRLPGVQVRTTFPNPATAGGRGGNQWPATGSR